MALVGQQHPAFGRLAECRGLAALAACLVLGACAQGPNLEATELLAGNDAPATSDEPSQSKAALEKATEYWGQRYAQNPRDLNTALNYAMDLKALGENRRALAVLQQASVFHGQSRALASEYGRLALELDQVNVAARLLAAADDPGNPDWRIISARGTVLAKQGKYSEAIPYYERALTLAHDQPSLLSNLALAHAMDGEPAKAEAMLRKAAASDPSSQKIRQNLALVLGLQGKYDEAKVIASRDMPAKNAAENTNYIRRVVKLKPKASPTTRAAPEVASADTGQEAPKSKAPAAENAKVAANTQIGAAPVTKVTQQAIDLPVRKPEVAVSENKHKAAEPKLAQHNGEMPVAKATQQAIDLPVRKPEVAVSENKPKTAEPKLAQHSGESLVAKAMQQPIDLPVRKPEVAVSENTAAPIDLPARKPELAVSENTAAPQIDPEAVPEPKLAQRSGHAPKRKASIPADKALGEPAWTPLDPAWTPQIALSNPHKSSDR